MPAIVLATLNARYAHTAVGLRCLMANLGELATQAAIKEFTIHDAPHVVVERLLAEAPQVVALSVAIWNRRESERVLRILRAVAPTVCVVLGGPELTEAKTDHPLLTLADVLVDGEGEAVFPGICRTLIAGGTVERVVRGIPPDLATMALPYDLYTDEDIAHRLIYVEATRGCPFTCAFCQSARDDKLRRVPPTRFLAAMERLLARGCRTFKFLDRSFNVLESTAIPVLEFFRARWRDGLFVHLEIMPDRVSPRLRALLASFPPGGVQLELGIQSFDATVLAGIQRRMDTEVAAEAIAWLRAHTGCHLHADLIAGLPGEDEAGFLRGFDRLWRLRPHEIQVGILKRLVGTPLNDSAALDMHFNQDPPYDLLCSAAWPFAAMQRVTRLARTVEVFHNRGGFTGAGVLLVGDGRPSVAWQGFAAWLHAHAGGDHGLSQARQYELLRRHLIEVHGHDAARVTATLRADYLVTGKERHLPECLR